MATIFGPAALAGTRTVVVGGTSGVGLHVARQVVAAGGKVVILGRSENKLASAAAELGPSSTAIACDATDESAVQKAFEGIGGFDHLVLSSGGAPGGKFIDQSLAQLQGIWTAKYWGEVIPARYGAPLCSTSVTFVGGFLSRKPIPGANQKCAVNAAIEGLAKCLAVELAPVRVNVVAPDGISAEPGVPRTSGVTEFKTSYFDVAQSILTLMLSKNTTGFVYDSSGGSLL